MKFFGSLFGKGQQAAKSVVPESIRPWCNCFGPDSQLQNWTEPKLHSEVQDTECDAWKWLESLIEEVRAKEQEEFAPKAEMGQDKWEQIVTLPASIGTLKLVRSLVLYGSHLVRIPREIGDMTNLSKFTPYTSYRLHWFPYEITRCKNLEGTTVSTRALYGNHRYRPPFPALPADPDPAAQGTVTENASGHETSMGSFTMCSMCDRVCPDSSLLRMWISSRVGADVLPLLVNACSEQCIWHLPFPPRGYVDRPHKGGLHLEQPPAEFVPPW